MYVRTLQPAVSGLLAERLVFAPEALPTLLGLGQTFGWHQLAQEGAVIFYFLFFVLDQLFICVKVLKVETCVWQAMSIMEVTHGKDHPYVRELRKQLKET